MAARLSTEEFIRRAKLVHGDKYEYINTHYINNKTKVEIICKEHGSFWQIPSSHINRKSGCPICNSSPTKTTDQFIKEAKEIHGNKYNYSRAIYKNNITKIEIICPEHGLFKQSPVKHLNGQGCKKCGHNMSNIEFIRQATEIHKGKYDYSKTKYINCYSRVIIICPVHGEFEQLATHHLHAKGNCPKCQVSRGEQKIADYLKAKRIKYIWEYRIENQLRFDFYLPDVNVAIEYDGEQHFKPILYYGGHDKLKETQQRDKKKNNYCQKAGIKLIRIPYTEFDKIEKILQKELNVT